MAHEISEIMVNGRTVAEAMYAGRPAWHGLGQLFGAGGAEAPDSAGAMELAHLNWRVEKEPLTLAADGKAVNDYFALVRQDTRDTLSVVGNDYQVLQNVDAFGFLDSLLADGILRYEAAFALKQGRGIVLLARMPSVDFITPDDASLRYILFNSWHGGRSISATPTSVRAECANLTRIAFARSTVALKIPHTGDLTGKLKTMHNYLSQWDCAFTDFRESAQKLLKGYSPDQAAAYVDALFPAPANGSGVRTMANHGRQIAELRKAFTAPAQTLGSIKGTWWALFNSVTAAIDHGQQARQSRNPFAALENRFIAVTTGPGAELKDKAFELALSMAA